MRQCWLWSVSQHFESVLRDDVRDYDVGMMYGMMYV
jgi:hypothetical protein